LNIRSIKKNWSEAWDVTTSALRQPLWDEQSLEQVRGQIISTLKMEQSDPDESVAELTRKTVFKGKRNSKSPHGTLETIQKFTIESCKVHYNKVLQRKKIVISICGNLTMEEVRKKVQQLSGFPLGEADVFTTQPIEIQFNAHTIQERDIATNYMVGVFSVPKVSTRESLVMRLALRMLSDRLFIEVRTKRNLSYAPNAYMFGSNDPYGCVTVSTTDPNAAGKVIIDEVKKLKKEGFLEKELTNMKASYLTTYYMGVETNEGQASMLGLYELRGGWEESEKLIEKMQSISLEEVNKVFNQYVTHVHWMYLGKKEGVDFSSFEL
jgi:predicted Zn-dependent peptidase